VNQLEILYFTDVHDDLKQLRYIVQNSKADLYLISGDLIYKAFYTEEKLYNFVELQDRLYSYITKNKLNVTPKQAALDILEKSENFDKDALIDAVEYNILFKIASTNMREKYQTLNDLFVKYAKAPVICLPGNYDMNLQHTALRDLDLHKKSRIINGLKISGYGGAPIVTSGIPENLSVHFNEYRKNDILYSEPFEFMKSEKPDILLVHNPAYATLDKISGYGSVGSFGLREYIDDFHPSLVLSGHVHEDCGLLKTGKTLCLNPSNFGGVDSVEGYSQGGYFCRIEIQKKEKILINKIDYYRLIGREIKHIAVVTADENLNLKQKILNEKEINKAGGFLR